MSNLLSPLVQDSLVKWSQRLFNAAQSGDKDLAVATLRELKLSIEANLYYIETEG
jgi:hypothetical protein